jgi:hypothetical protein
MEGPGGFGRGSWDASLTESDGFTDTQDRVFGFAPV